MFLQGVVYGILGMVGWGTSDFFAAFASKKIGNITTQFWSLAIGTILFLSFSFFAKTSFTFSQSFLLTMALASLLQVAGSYFFLKAFSIGKVSLVSPIASSFGMWTSIFALIFLHEHISLFQGIVIFMILTGIFLTSTNLQELKKNAKFVTSDIGVRYAFIASLLWAASFTIYSPLVKSHGWLECVLLLRIFMVIFLSIFLFVKRQTILFAAQQKSVFSVIATGVMDIVGYGGYSLALSYGLTAIVSPITAAFPIITVGCAQLFLKEKLAKEHLSGIILIIFGLILLSL